MEHPLLDCQLNEASFANIVHPHGEIDLSTVPVLRRALQEAVSLGRHVIVDLSDVTFIDSTGFREFLIHRRVCRENDRLMALVNPRDRVQHVIDALNFFQMIPVFPSMDAAQTSLKGMPLPGERPDRHRAAARPE
ncbi:MAG: STAS domain-containing protein [bacterium]